MYLSSNIDQRDNNLNLIRSIAAIVVIISHSYPLLYGKGNYDFLYNRLGITLGEVAVDVFFLISGFLISISLVSKKSLFYYFIAIVVYAEYQFV
jgi:peptidoglycan/LPS O-acetylase OafA/YrhL